MRRYGHRIPYINPVNIEKFIHISHSRNAASKLIKDCDLFIGWTGSSLEALIAARNSGVTTILERGSSHCSAWRKLMSEEYSTIGKQFDPMYHFWQRELLEYELADYISIPSTFVRNTFIQHGVPAEKLLINTYGVNLNSFHQVEKEDKIFRVITVGGLSLRKGSRYLLQAFSELNLPDAELWHIGSINPEMQPFIKKYSSDKIIFQGHKPQSELFKYYSQGSVFVLMSIEEGLAMVQCQAMACGLPLICSSNTGGSDLIGNDEKAGYEVPVRNVEALKSKILHLYENQDQCRAMGQIAKQRITTGLTWSDYGTRYADNIRKIVRN